MKYALVNTDGDVENIVVGDEDYASQKYETVNIGGLNVQPGDYRDPDTGDFITPRFKIQSPDTLANDGATEATVEVTTTARDTQQATITIADAETTAEVTPNGSHTETITTTASAGTIIEVRVESAQIQGDRAEIEVVQA